MVRRNRESVFSVLLHRGGFNDRSKGGRNGVRQHEVASCGVGVLQAVAGDGAYDGAVRQIILELEDAGNACS